ncbi:MAG: hybrid sensor histidine kinase/response regulator, partial [Spirochaetaceae bacterium]
VKLSSIEKIMQSMNQIVIKQFQFKKIQEDLHSAAAAMQEHYVELRRDSANAAMYREFQELQKSVSAIQKSFADQIAVIERNTYELQEQLMRLTMLPLELIFGSIPRMVEEVTAMLGKDVECQISGTEVLLDKAILEKLYDPVIHIVRNSLDHGLETSAEREASGKPAQGSLEISCTSEGGNINIRIKDDGRGIDRDQVAQRALERNLITQDRLEELSESDIYGLLFSPGFSTKSEVTDLSGRGVGLDIVRHNIQKVKGKITIQSEKGVGTEFLLSLPLSLATVSGFFISSGERKFLIPSNFVHKIVRLSQKDKLSYYNKEAFKLENQIIPLYSLASLLGIVSESENREHLTVMVVESVGERIGVLVDAVLHHVQLIYKPLPRNLLRLKLIQGIVFDETYSIINILFVPELMKAFKSMKAVDILKGKVAAQVHAKQVLVVDDSLNTREIEKSILELEGFEVTTANDGIDGLEKLKAGRFDLVVTDIEMPRMDGVTMVENIRKEARHKTLPIIVISSHTEESVRRSVTEAGANAYIVKSDFDRNSLSAIAHRLT